MTLRPERIPLFPLNIVLFPDEQVPLHIFEPRYRRMVRDCLDNHSPFGMLLAQPTGIAKIGCTAEILEVLKTYQDGRMDIITAGRDPFRLVKIFEGDPLLEGTVDYLEDWPSPAVPSQQQQLIEQYETCHTLLFSSMPMDLVAQGPMALSYAISSSLPLDLVWKQQILEFRSEEERQAHLLAYLREWAPHLQKEGGLRQSAAGNGHGLN